MGRVLLIGGVALVCVVILMLCVKLDDTAIGRRLPRTLTGLMVACALVLWMVSCT